jgi:hypothetical protein
MSGLRGNIDAAERRPEPVARDLEYVLETAQSRAALNMLLTK